MSSVRPGDSASNQSCGELPAARLALDPPDFGFLASLFSSPHSEEFKSQVITKYADTYGAYCRASVGFNANMNVKTDDASGFNGLQAVDMLRDLELCDAGGVFTRAPCASPCATSSLSSSGSSGSGLTSSRRRALASTRTIGYKQSVAVATSKFPRGLCYARAFRKVAREAVAYDLGFWPKFSEVLGRPMEAALPLCGTESLVVVQNDLGYHLADADAVAVGEVTYPYNDVVVGLSRRQTFPFGSYGSHLASVKGFVVLSHDAANLVSPEDLLGGDSGGGLPPEFHLGRNSCRYTLSRKRRRLATDCYSESSLNVASAREAARRALLYSRASGDWYAYSEQFSLDQLRDTVSNLQGFLHTSSGTYAQELCHDIMFTASSDLENYREYLLDYGVEFVRSFKSSDFGVKPVFSPRDYFRVAQGCVKSLNGFALCDEQLFDEGRLSALYVAIGFVALAFNPVAALNLMTFLKLNDYQFDLSFWNERY